MFIPANLVHGFVQGIDSPWQASWDEFIGTSRAYICGLFPGHFLSAFVLGVRPERPAARKDLLIELRLGGLTIAEGVVVTEFGPVPVWRATLTGLGFNILVPAGTSATLGLRKPAADYVPGLDGGPGEFRTDGSYLGLGVGAGGHAGSIVSRTTDNSA